MAAGGVWIATAARECQLILTPLFPVALSCFSCAIQARRVSFMGFLFAVPGQTWTGPHLLTRGAAGHQQNSIFQVLESVVYYHPLSGFGHAGDPIKKV